ncbi:MAG: LamG domain-containing protein [Gammaproteobacteria bacterium]|nr:LamG domain-containing protein [Gammaproteobacteria bacterium]
MLVGQHNRPPGQPPRWPFALDWESAQARGIVLAAPFLHGLPPMDLVKARVFAWSGTAPSSIAPVCLQGRPVDALVVDANDSGYVATSDDYGLPGVNTLSVEWWMSEDGNYLSGDLDRYIVSTRTGGGVGWSAGRFFAVGGPPGNATRPRFTIQGVANYDATTFDIPARKWVHVCITLDGTALTMYVDGVSIYTTTTASMTTGGSVVLLGQGPSGALPWTNNVHSLIVRRAVLTAAEVRERANPSTTFGLYHELGRKTWFLPGAAAPGGGIKGAALTRSVLLNRRRLAA